MEEDVGMEMISSIAVFTRGSFANKETESAFCQQSAFKHKALFALSFDVIFFGIQHMLICCAPRESTLDEVHTRWCESTLNHSRYNF